jgi:hypothetical protein
MSLVQIQTPFTTSASHQHGGKASTRTRLGQDISSTTRSGKIRTKKFQLNHRTMSADRAARSSGTLLTNLWDYLMSQSNSAGRPSLFFTMRKEGFTFDVHTLQLQNVMKMQHAHNPIFVEISVLNRVLIEIIAYFSFRRHGPHRKQRLQKFFFGAKTCLHSRCLATTGGIYSAVHYIAVGPRQHSDSWIQVPGGSWTLFTVWQQWKPGYNCSKGRYMHFSLTGRSVLLNSLKSPTEDKWM